MSKGYHQKTWKKKLIKIKNNWIRSKNIITPQMVQSHIINVEVNSTKIDLDHGIHQM